MRFLKKKFYEYYLKPDIIFPSRIDRREFAFLSFSDTMMRRHISFPTRDRLLYYLRINAPAHAYYSSAYYRRPDAATMQEKEWMGADLIFDLDADHIPGAFESGYENALRMVKKEMKKLLDFLLEDFGFDKNKMHVFFSGGRGYHCHVFDRRVIELGSGERREIVDYITARGLDMDSVIVEKEIFADGYSIKKVEIMPSLPSWRGRIARGIIEFLKEIKSMEREDAIKKMMELEGIGRKIAESIYDSLDEERMKRIEEGMIDQLSAYKRLIKPLAKKLAVSLHSSTDEPVTADIKRLIRLPGSLHGKTGLKVEKVDIDAIDEFEPLRDAIAFGDEIVEIEVKKPFSIEMNEERYELKKGRARVPEYVAVFAVARGFAEG